MTLNTDILVEIGNFQGRSFSMFNDVGDVSLFKSGNNMIVEEYNQGTNTWSPKGGEIGFNDPSKVLLNWKLSGDGNTVVAVSFFVVPDPITFLVARFNQSSNDWIITEHLIDPSVNRVNNLEVSKDGNTACLVLRKPSSNPPKFILELYTISLDGSTFERTGQTEGIDLLNYFLQNSSIFGTLSNSVFLQHFKFIEVLNTGLKLVTFKCTFDGNTSIVIFKWNSTTNLFEYCDFLRIGGIDIEDYLISNDGRTIVISHRTPSPFKYQYVAIYGFDLNVTNKIIYNERSNYLSNSIILKDTSNNAQDVEGYADYYASRPSPSLATFYTFTPLKFTENGELYILSTKQENLLSNDRYTFILNKFTRRQAEQNTWDSYPTPIFTNSETTERSSAPQLSVTFAKNSNVIFLNNEIYILQYLRFHCSFLLKKCETFRKIREIAQSLIFLKNLTNDLNFFLHVSFSFVR
jgi:hypothetical protein